MQFISFLHWYAVAANWKTTALGRGQTDRVDLALTLDLQSSPRWAVVMTHTHAKCQRSLCSKVIRVKINGQTEPFTLPASLRWSVMNVDVDDVGWKQGDCSRHVQTELPRPTDHRCVVCIKLMELESVGLDAIIVIWACVSLCQQQHTTAAVAQVICRKRRVWCQKFPKNTELTNFSKFFTLTVWTLIFLYDISH